MILLATMFLAGQANSFSRYNTTAPYSINFTRQFLYTPSNDTITP